jgi:anti-sigma regulatory factor (Ser/Thr protein kinase)
MRAHPRATGRTTFTLSAELPATARARDALARALAVQHWPPERVSDVLLAGGEALANAVLHGSTPGGCVDVEFAVTRDRAWLRVADHGGAGTGVPTCPWQVPDAAATGGRGLLLMRALARRMQVRPVGEGTEVVLDFAAVG